MNNEDDFDEFSECINEPIRVRSYNVKKQEHGGQYPLITINKSHLAMFSKQFKVSLGQLSKHRVCVMQALIRGHIERKNGYYAKHLRYKTDSKYLKLKMRLMMMVNYDR